MNPRRLRLLTILAGAALGALTLAAWTQPWFALILDSGRTLSATGQVAAPALSALGLASLALAAALSIAGRVVRIGLGVLEAVLGVLVVVTSVSALGDPVAASAAKVTDATAISGAHSVAAIVASVSASAWPYAAVLFGALLALVGVVAALTSRRWPGPTRKYEAEGNEGAIGAWDALSGGHDPT